MKVKVEDQDLAQKIREYLSVSGIEIEEDAPIHITTTGGPSKVPQLDVSGSGIMTSGGRLAPGYDAKLKSALQHIVRGTPDKMPEELKENGPMYRPIDEWTPELAAAALEELGWPLPVPKKVKPKKEKAESDGDDDGSVNSDGQEKGQSKASRRRIKAGQATPTEAAESTEEAEAEAEATV